MTRQHPKRARVRLWSLSSFDAPLPALVMGILLLEECAAKGCDTLRRSLSEGVELDIGPLLSSPNGKGLHAQRCVLWACCPMHARACRAAVLADLASGGRGKEQRERRGAAELSGAVAVRELLRLTVARGRPQNELLWRLVARIAPELVAGFGDEDVEAAAADAQAAQPE